MTFLRRALSPSPSSSPARHCSSVVRARRPYGARLRLATAGSAACCHRPMRPLSSPTSNADVTIAVDPLEITLLEAFGQRYDAGSVEAYEEAGVDRLVVTPWLRSREARDRLVAFAADADLALREPGAAEL
jgi:hypothetical protein